MIMISFTPSVVRLTRRTCEKRHNSLPSPWRVSAAVRSKKTLRVYDPVVARCQLFLAFFNRLNCEELKRAGMFVIGLFIFYGASSVLLL